MTPPLPPGLTLHVLSSADLPPGWHDEIVALCSAAFKLDYAPFLRSFGPATHVLARLDGALVSHALWITRWLQQGQGPLLRTAYIEGVATVATRRGQGFGSAVMRRLAQEIVEFDVAALCTGSFGFYARLGWEQWRGPLSWRRDGASVPYSDGHVMLLRLPASPPLDLDGPLSVEWREGEVW